MMALQNEALSSTDHELGSGSSFALNGTVIQHEQHRNDDERNGREKQHGG